MTSPQVIEREWLLRDVAKEVQIRCRFRRRAHQILDYTVQLEIKRNATWEPIARYDNAHGFCHRDTIHPDGTQDKTAIYWGDTNLNFTRAISEFRSNWESERARYLSEVDS